MGDFCFSSFAPLVAAPEAKLRGGKLFVVSVARHLGLTVNSAVTRLILRHQSVYVAQAELPLFSLCEFPNRNSGDLLVRLFFSPIRQIQMN